MYNTIIRASGVDVAALVLWLASTALFVRLIVNGSEIAFGIGAILTGIGAAATWVTAVIRRTEHRLADQMTIEHRAQSGTQPTILSSVR